MINKDIYKQAIDVAKNDNINSLPDTVVLYSISFLPTTENKEKAFRYIDENSSAMTIEKTECGKRLLKLGLDFDVLPDEDKAVAGLRRGQSGEIRGGVDAGPALGDNGFLRDGL